MTTFEYHIQNEAKRFQAAISATRMELMGTGAAGCERFANRVEHRMYVCNLLKEISEAVR